MKKYQDDPTQPTCTTRLCSRTGKLLSAVRIPLKGVAQNLGFERLYQVSAVLTEAMRGEKPLEDRSLLDAVEQQDAAIRRAISSLRSKGRTVCCPFETVKKNFVFRTVSPETTLSERKPKKTVPYGHIFSSLYKFRDICCRNL